MATSRDVIQLASAELGKPYVYGDEGPNTFDCSGLMQFVFAKVGIKLPRTADQQQRATSPVGSPQPGDLVFWGNPAYHVALYIGGGKVISAPKPGDRVKVQDVWGKPTYGRVSGLGGALAPVAAGIAGATDVAGAVVSTVLGGTRSVILEGLFLGAGVALVGLGVVRVVAPRLAKGVIG